jgi:hypothetical protein
MKKEDLSNQSKDMGQDFSHYLLNEKVAVLEGEYQGRSGVVSRVLKQSEVVLVDFGKYSRPYHIHQVRHALRATD